MFNAWATMHVCTCPQLSPLIEEYSRGPAKQKNALLNFLGTSNDELGAKAGGKRPEELRRVVAHVFRWVQALHVARVR